jgi:hypothetical protein
MPAPAPYREQAGKNPVERVLGMRSADVRDIGGVDLICSIVRDTSLPALPVCFFIQLPFGSSLLTSRVDTDDLGESFFWRAGVARLALPDPPE